MKNPPKGIQRKRIPGYRHPNNTVSVARPSIFGNLFEVTETRDALAATRLFAFWLLSDKFTFQPDRKKRIWENIHKLRGKNLSCFCPLDQPCHRNVLLVLANHKILQGKIPMKKKTEYEPYALEWKKKMMKFRKYELIGLLKKAYQQLDQAKKEMNARV